MTNLAINASLIAEINKDKGDIPDITNLATINALTAVESKISGVTNLVEKTDYNTIINEIEKKVTDHNRDKYITTPEFQKFAAEIFALRLKRANLASKVIFFNK